MPDRLAPLSPSQMNAEQKAAHEHASSIGESMFGSSFQYKASSKNNNDEADAAMIGPFAPLMYTPNIVKPFFDLVVEVGKIPGLPQSARETVILATGSHFKAAYELYAHGHVAEDKTGLTERQIEDLKKGVKAEGLDEQCQIAFDVALELSRGGGPLSETSWNRAVEVFGKEGTAALVHFVGLYAYTCVLLNAVDASVPEKK